MTQIISYNYLINKKLIYLSVSFMETLPKMRFFHIPQTLRTLIIKGTTKNIDLGILFGLC